MSNKLDNQLTLDGTSGLGAGPGFIEWRGVVGFQQNAIFQGVGPPGPGPVAGQTGAAALYIDVIGAVVPGPVPPFFLAPTWTTADSGATWHQMIVS